MLPKIKKIIFENYTDIHTEIDSENSLRVALRENYWIEFFIKNVNENNVMVMSLLLWKNFEDFPVYGEMAEYQERMEKYLEINHFSPKNRIVNSGGYFYLEQSINNTENLKENIDEIMSLATSLHYI